MNYRAIFLAVMQASAMFVSGFVIPLVGQVVAVFAPVPLVTLSLREGRQSGLIALLAATALTGVLFGWQPGGIFLFSFGLMAVGLSEGLRRQWKPDSSAILAGMLPITALGLVTSYYFVRIGKNPVTVVETYLRTSMSDAAKMYTQLGFTEMASIINSLPETWVHNLVLLIPGITIATSVFQAAFCYGVSRTLVTNRPGPATPPLDRTTLSQWHAPDVWVWGLILGLSLIMVPQESVRFTGWNISIVYCLIYLVQGIGIVDHFLRKWQAQPFMRGMIHTIILALPSIVFVIALGIVDIWADLRKLRGPAGTAGDQSDR